MKDKLVIGAVVAGAVALVVTIIALLTRSPKPATAPKSQVARPQTGSAYTVPDYGAIDFKLEKGQGMGVFGGDY